MYRRLDRASQWALGLSVPLGVVGMVPFASYVYAEMGGWVWTPWLWYSGVVYYGIRQQDVLLSGLAGLGAGIAFPLLVAITLLVPKPLHGVARLARRAEIARARLFKAGGYSILLGRYGRKLLAFNDDLHVFLAAATGTGKGVAFVIINLLHWRGSVLCLDVKGENFALTSGFRGRTLGQLVFRFDPLQQDGRTHRFNVLAYVREGPLRVTDVQTIAAILVPEEGHDPYWSTAARDLCMGLILLVIEAGPALRWPVTIGQVHWLIRTEQETSAVLKGLLVEVASKNLTLSDICRRYILSFCNEPEKSRGSIKSHLTTKLTLWANPLIDRATAGNDFDLLAFRRVPMTLYLAIAPDDLTRLSPLVRLLIEFFLSGNTKSGETPRDHPELKVPVLILLDEFLSLGKMERLVQALAYVRGWGIKIATVIQSEAQLQALYGRELAEFYVDNHRARVYFRPPVHRRDLAEAISKTIGTATVMQTSYSYHLGRRTRQVSPVAQAILDPDEIAHLGNDETIVLVEGLRALIGRKVIYYRDRRFRKRCRSALPLPAVTPASPSAALATPVGVVERAAPVAPAVRYASPEAITAALDAIPTPPGLPSEAALMTLAQAIAQVVHQSAPQALAALAGRGADQEAADRSY